MMQRCHNENDTSYERYGARWNEANGGTITNANDPIQVLPWFESMADAGLLFYDASAGPNSTSAYSAAAAPSPHTSNVSGFVESGLT